jgi:hypothetical protein
VLVFVPIAVYIEVSTYYIQWRFLPQIYKLFENIESLLEVTFNKQKCLFLSVYKPPSMRDNIFSDDFNKTTDKIVKMYDNFIIMGDINFNMLDDVNNVALRDLIFLFLTSR